MSSVHAEPPPPIVAEPTGINYATGPALGKGGFAICHRAERYDGSRPTGHVVALKIVKTKMEPPKLAQKFVTELQIHSKLSHPNVVTFYRAFAFQTSTYVVLELCPNGSLADMLKKRKQLTLPEIRRFVIQICGAVKYLHHRHIVHRDLKTGNLFLDENMNVKVGDFGLAALLVTERDFQVTRRTTMCGTPNYLAPEILEKGKGHDEKVDLWAIGVIAYTLAVGKAPFHASTKEEIYKKLKSGSYTWPELSATTNQSPALRDLVSSLLVPEEQRLVPDQIVSQAFFKIAYVPANVPVTAKEKAPRWSDNSVPSADTIRRGYSDTWYALCKDSGVGELSEGKTFKLNGGKRVKSIVYDMAHEVQLGLQPSMPIPIDTVYTSTVNSWDQLLAVPEESFEHEKLGRELKEISGNEGPRVRPIAADVKPAIDAELMPPPARVVSRSTKTGTVRRTARTISEETAKATNGEHFKVGMDAPKPTLSVPKTRKVAVPVPMALKDTNSTTDLYQTAQSQKSSESSSDQSTKAGTAKRAADASLARRPRSTKPKALVESVQKLEALPTLEQLKQASPGKRTRKRAAQEEIFEIHSDGEEPKEKPTARGGSTATMPSRPPAPVMQKAALVAGINHSPDCIPTTDPAVVLARLSTFRDNLAAALSNAPRARTSSAEAENLPFVSRWVDYSRKHGVGYVLADGTVGCIINSSAKNNTPVTHVLARNGCRWLAKIGKDFERMDSAPLEVFEDHSDQGIRRKVYKGLGAVKEGPLAEEAERRRTLGVLWVKFGRYMCQSLDSEGANLERSADNFVRFYQRIGNVGIWMFADGCMQAHFPDHTKLVLSSRGTHISATFITPEASTYLSVNEALLPHHVAGREVFADTVSGLLHEGGRLRGRFVKANALADKLRFLLHLVDQWIANGGLGRLDADEKGSRANVPEWKGLAVSDGLKKLGRVTVGRMGGDVCVD